MGELAHGRIAQLAVVGFLWPGLFGTFPGSDEFGGVDAYSELNPFKALTTVPESALFQIVAGAAWFEYQRVIRIREQGADRVLGDIGIGYPGGWNPLNLNYSPEEYAEKQGQAVNSGTDVVTQLSPAFAAPEYASKAGYFLPQGKKIQVEEEITNEVHICVLHTQLMWLCCTQCRLQGHNAAALILLG